jgi:hypothetical protein
MATKRNLEALDARRVKGARMLKRGVAQAECRGGWGCRASR